MTSSNPFDAFLAQMQPQGANTSAAGPVNSFAVKSVHGDVNTLKMSDEQQRVIDLALLGKDVIVDATVGSGKALDNDSYVPTPLGHKLVKDIKVGDYLFDRKGRPTRVKGVYPQGAVDAYEVVLADQRTVVCSADHNWSVRYTSSLRQGWRTLTTREMLMKGLKRTSGAFQVYRFAIPSHEAVFYPERELPVHPYVLGAFIGNGSCKERTLALSAHTDEVPLKVAALLGEGTTVHRRSEFNWTWDFKTRDGKRIRTADIFEGLENYVMCYSHEKSIPYEYLAASIDQRFELMKGLMDTDGSIYPAGGRYNVRYSSTSSQLCDDIIDLAGSLGMVVHPCLDSRSGTGKYVADECFSLNFNVSNDMKPLLFSVEAKHRMAVEASYKQKRRNYDEVRVADIVPLGEKRNMTCFEVENDEHLFLANDYVVTHNTTAIQRLCNELRASDSQVRILYLTYSKLLKEDAQQRVTGARVQNYHGIVYPSLLGAGLRCGISESIATFNKNFKKLSADFPTYDVLVIDEYQDITEEYAQLLRNIKSKNPTMQIIMVGDMEQRVSAASRHNAQEFAKSFCIEPEYVSFTQSFRIGQQMADALSASWNKPIKGVNHKQIIQVISYNEAVKQMLAMRDRPGDILCLGSRNGGMTDALNAIERAAPEVFNKNTVYASVRDGDKGGFSPTSSIFTTFDSSKGLERDTCFVFDYTERKFDVRLGFHDADATVLRNIFLVAASRGKNRVFFVDMKGEYPGTLPGDMFDDSVGLIPQDRFTNLPDVSRPQYGKGDLFDVASMFDFKYIETVDEAHALLDTERLDDEKSEPIEFELSDGLIDLWGVMNFYQMLAFFTKFDSVSQFSVAQGHAREKFEDHLYKMQNRKMTSAQSDLTIMPGLDDWEISLAFVAAWTNYDRYAEQVTVKPTPEVVDQLMSRLAEHLDHNEDVQRDYMLMGEARYTRTEKSDIGFVGVADVVRDNSVWSIHFTNELTHTYYLRAAMLAVMANKDYAVLWNVRTNERQEIRVPDRQRFLDAVVNCVTKQSYSSFRE